MLVYSGYPSRIRLLHLGGYLRQTPVLARRCFHILREAAHCLSAQANQLVAACWQRRVHEACFCAGPRLSAVSQEACCPLNRVW